jgi:hypothetical protein
MKGVTMTLKGGFKNVVILMIGVLMTLTLLLLTGAASVNDAPQIGRYRLTAVVRGNFPDLFVIDTATGAVKWVGNDEGKPFAQIKGR